MVKRAGDVLRRLEAGHGPDGQKATVQLPLFAHAAPVMAEPEPEPLVPAVPAGEAVAIDQLKAIDPDGLTPRAALELIYTLSGLAKDEGEKP